MPKFYVCSGDLKKVIDRPNAEQAAVDVCKTLENESLGFAIAVSELGFNTNNSRDILFPTMEILEKSDQLENYKCSEW